MNNAPIFSREWLFNIRLFFHQLRNRKKIKNFYERWDEGAYGKAFVKRKRASSFKDSRYNLVFSEKEVRKMLLEIEGASTITIDYKEIISILPRDINMGDEYYYCCVIKLNSSKELKLRYSNVLCRQFALRQLSFAALLCNPNSIWSWEVGEREFLLSKKLPKEILEDQKDHHSLLQENGVILDNDGLFRDKKTPPKMIVEKVAKYGLREVMEEYKHSL